jgi:hypothetical protein
LSQKDGKGLAKWRDVLFQKKDFHKPGLFRSTMDVQTNKDNRICFCIEMRGSSTSIEGTFSSK